MIIQHTEKRKEWEAAFNPSVPVAPFYDRPSFDKTAVNYFRWQFLDGDADILPGLKVITTPGHTIGHQSVLFDTEQGVLCVSGDICNVAENVNVGGSVKLLDGKVFFHVLSPPSSCLVCSPIAEMFSVI